MAFPVLELKCAMVIFCEFVKIFKTTTFLIIELYFGSYYVHKYLKWSFNIFIKLINEQYKVLAGGLVDSWPLVTIIFMAYYLALRWNVNSKFPYNVRCFCSYNYFFNQIFRTFCYWTLGWKGRRSTDWLFRSRKAAASKTKD